MRRENSIIFDVMLEGAIDSTRIKTDMWRFV